MTKNEKVAKIIEEQFGLKTIKGSFYRNKREQSDTLLNGIRWAMKVDPAQFPPYGTPAEKCKYIKLFDMFLCNPRETTGIYDECFDDRYADLYQLGSEYTLQEILDTVKDRGIEYLYLQYQNEMFEIGISERKYEYKGDYNEVKHKYLCRS